MFDRLCVVLLSGALLAAAEHRPLLPKPREISYGAGKLALANLHLGFAGAPSAEDRFAAEQLATELSRVAGSPVRVAENANPERAVIFKRTGAVAALPEKDERPGPEGRESYRIRITPVGAEVTAPSSAGLFYAVQTLKQMIEGRDSSAFLPVADVHDWPALAYRGFMMDFSHGSLMQEQEILRQIDFLARWKANQYYFYSEASIELKGFPLLNPRARYRQEQVRRIIEYARLRHIDVVPCLEYYGHLHDLFRVERYADTAVLPHGGDLNPRHPGTDALVKDWIAQMAALFPSPWFHVGLDEPFELASVAAAGTDPRAVWREQFERVTGAARAHGKRVLFWADIDTGSEMLSKHPELMTNLSADLLPVPWYYAAMPDYTKWVEPFGKAGKAQVIAPGITCWNEIVPDYPTTFANIDGFLASGRKYGAIGMVNTGWTDSAQVIYRTFLPGLAYGAVAAWQDQPVDRSAFFSTYSRLTYAEPVASEVGPALEALSKARERLAEAIGSDTLLRLWDDALEPQRIEKSAAHREQLREGRLLAEDALERIGRALESAPGDDTLASLRLAAGMLDYLGMKYQYGVDIAEFFRRAGPHPSSKEIWLYLQYEISFEDHGHVADLMDTITGLRDEYEQAWDREWTAYRRRSALGRWDAEYEYWRAFQARLNAFTERMKPGDPMPPLESFRR